MRDPRSGRLLAAVTSPFYGPKICYADDPAGEWQQAEGVALPEGGDAGARAHLGDRAPARPTATLYAGGDPGVLFESRDGGATWELQPRAVGAPDAAAVAAGRRRAVPALDRALAGRARPARARRSRPSGVWLTDDGGATWRHGNDGHRPALPARGRARGPDRSCACTTCSRAPRAARAAVHAVPRRRLPLRRRRASWTDIGAGLPSDFGFPLAIDPADPDSAYVIPLDADIDRVTPDGRVRVYETRDARRDAGRRAATACRQQHAYLTVLRQAFDRAGEGDALELYFGATSGDVFGSGDAGATLVRRRRATCRRCTACAPAPEMARGRIWSRFGFQR